VVRIESVHSFVRNGREGNGGTAYTLSAVEGVPVPYLPRGDIYWDQAA